MSDGCKLWRGIVIAEFQRSHRSFTECFADAQKTSAEGKIECIRWQESRKAHNVGIPAFRASNNIVVPILRRGHQIGDGGAVKVVIDELEQPLPQR